MLVSTTSILTTRTVLLYYKDAYISNMSADGLDRAAIDKGEDVGGTKELLQGILAELKGINKQLRQQDKRLTKVEQKTEKPGSTYRDELVKPVPPPCSCT
jgi:hypothetical protein